MVSTAVSVSDTSKMSRNGVRIYQKLFLSKSHVCDLEEMFADKSARQKYKQTSIPYLLACFVRYCITAASRSPLYTHF